MKTVRAKRPVLPPSLAIDLIANALCVILLVHVLKAENELPLRTSTQNDIEGERITEAELLATETAKMAESFRRSWSARSPGLPVLQGRAHFLIDVSGSTVDDGLLSASAALQTILILNEVGMTHLKVSLFDHRYQTLVDWTKLDYETATALDVVPSVLADASPEVSRRLLAGSRLKVVNRICECTERIASKKTQADDIGAGKTDLDQALVEALRDAQSSPEPTTIILLTDGLHFGPKTQDGGERRAELNESLRRHAINVKSLRLDVTLHAVALIPQRYFSDPPPKEDPLQILPLLANLTGEWRGVAIALPLPPVASFGKMNQLTDVPDVPAGETTPLQPSTGAPGFYDGP